MTTVREGLEQAVLLSIGAASLTRERAEAAVAELVRKGQIGGDEGKAVVNRLMARVRGDGASSPASSLMGRLEGGVQGVLREFGVVTRAELEDVQLRLMELEHRISLLEKAPPPTRPERPRLPDRGSGAPSGSTDTLARMARGERRQNLARIGEIAHVAARHGFGYAFGRGEEAGEAAGSGRSRGRRMREMLDELGPTFVKFGQLLSTRPDVVPPDILQELRGLQDAARPSPSSGSGG